MGIKQYSNTRLPETRNGKNTIFRGELIWAIEVERWSLPKSDAGGKARNDSATGDSDYRRSSETRAIYRSACLAFRSQKSLYVV
jgi:hypothetical protein